MASDVAQLHTRIGRAILNEAPAKDWAQLRVVYVVAGNVSERREWALLTDGTEEEIDVDRDVRQALRELRSAMHDPERGIWYTANVTVTRELRLSIDFDYDHEPEWGLAISPLSYAEDLELFPRHDDAIPDWLRQQLAEARS